jgi:hypothetical protein
LDETDSELESETSETTFTELPELTEVTNLITTLTFTDNVITLPVEAWVQSISCNFKFGIRKSPFGNKTQYINSVGAYGIDKSILVQVTVLPGRIEIHWSPIVEVNIIEESEDELV